MTKLLKRSCALVLAGVLAAGCMTASAKTSVRVENMNYQVRRTIYGNNATCTQSVTIKDLAFDKVGGEDLTVKLDPRLVIVVDNEHAITIKSNTGAALTLTGGLHYTLENNTCDETGTTPTYLHVVNLFNIANAPIAGKKFELTFDVTIPSEDIQGGSYYINVVDSDSKLAGNELSNIKGHPMVGAEDGDQVNLVNGAFVVGQKILSNRSIDETSLGVTASDDHKTLTFHQNSTALEAGAFIPYGAVVDRSGNYLRKVSTSGNAQGDTTVFASDTALTSYTVVEFKNPAAGKPLTTFGASKRVANVVSGEHDTENGIQFGTYVPAYDSNMQYGTLFIKGNFEAFKDYFYSTRETFNNDEDFFRAFVGRLNGNTIKIAYNDIDNNDKPETILINKVDQTKYLWHKDGVLEYALRIYNITGDDQDVKFTAVGYARNKSTGAYTFSTETKYKTFNELG